MLVRLNWSEPEDDSWIVRVNALRYSTGEEIYKTDCPVFASKGIQRS